jgi:hypothetical protein
MCEGIGRQAGKASDEVLEHVGALGVQVGLTSLLQVRAGQPDFRAWDSNPMEFLEERDDFRK